MPSYGQLENAMKLRPEQRKLFRRIFLTAFDTGATVEEATAMADKAVAEWEARGAFEADLPSDPTSWEAFARHVGILLADNRSPSEISSLLRDEYRDDFDFMQSLLAQ